ncbi:MAG TPA: NAD(P)/FAD-dependent oxidoreductase, partial [Gemmataceae bacterium]
IAERWRSERWDSLVANGPAWHDRFPGMEFADANPDSFIGKEEIADYFVAYAKMIAAPIRCGVEVKELRRNIGRPGFHVETSNGVVEAKNVVAATGPFQRPVMPKLVPADAGLMQIHSNSYRNPGLLPEGAVLVVGSGSSGAQIADELARAGRRVFLSVGPHERPPRSYRGREFCFWWGVLGIWDLETPPLGAKPVAVALSGARGGETVDFRRLVARGVTLVGRTEYYRDGVVAFAPDLAQNIARGDATLMAFLDDADAYVARNGLDLPEEPDARKLGPNPECVDNPIFELDVAKAGLTSIIWATGYSRDYNWLKVDTFDENGRPKHSRGVSAEPGIYFLGLPWQSRKASIFICGVWHDAKYLADRISTRHKYLEYHAAAQRESEDA